MFSQAPPQWALASHENGFSYLSWKRKTLLAAFIVACGGGLAAQFPNLTPSLTVPGESVAVSSDFAQANVDNAIPSLSLPQDRYANNAQATPKKGAPSFAKPNEQIGRYTEPPAMNKESESEDSPSAPQSTPLRRTKVFESIDDSGFKKTALDLPLAKWNPLFDQSPPLSGRPLRPLIDDSALVPALPETVQAMKAEVEPFIRVMIDPSHLVPAEEQKITVLVQEDSIVPAEDYP